MKLFSLLPVKGFLTAVEVSGFRFQEEKELEHPNPETGR